MTEIPDAELWIDPSAAKPENHALGREDEHKSKRRSTVVLHFAKQRLIDINNLGEEKGDTQPLPILNLNNVYYIIIT